MRRFTTFFCLLAAAALLVSDASAQQEATITGTVSDAREGFGLAAANVVLLDEAGAAMVGGTATDEEGRYRLLGIPPGDYVLEFRYVGYAVVRESISLAAGETRSLVVALSPTGLDLSTVVVTASRQPEKVLDAPASISVLDTDDIESNVVSSSAAVLRNTTGVDMAQTGIDRYEIVLRGFNNAFSGATYVLTDYRQGAIASLGVNAYNMMPITQIDLERVEVVRGPGSALYGPGVDAGVVHFISKDPFTHPGTTVSIGGGTREMLLASARHAGVVDDRLGYKFVGNLLRAEEWHFDPDDPLDRRQLDGFREEALPVDYDMHKYNLNGTVAYRFRPDVTLTANGGFSSAKSIFLSGIGTLQSDGFGYSYGQLRLQAGDFFAQTYVNANNAGDSFVYRDFAVEDVVDNSVLVTSQVQYRFDAAAERLHLIVGADHELTRPDTEETITGRNENDDTIREIGAYTQGTFRVSPQLDATLALRGDYDNIFEEFQLSPRAALVFKPSAEHSLRATYNRAFSSPSSNSLFLDIMVGSVSALTIQARGSVYGFNFQRDPAFGGLVASSLIPSSFGSPMPVGMPLPVVYDGLYNALASISPAVLRAALQQQGFDVTQEEIEQIVALLSPQAGTNVTGFTESMLGWLNLTTESIDRTGTDVVDIAPLKQTESRTFEVGYKGLVADRLLLAVDGFYVNKRNFVGPLLVESPFVLAPSHEAIIADLQAAMADGIEGNAPLSAALQQYQLTPEQLAELLTLLGRSALEERLPEASSPIGIVQPVENAVPGQLLLAYRNYGDVSYYGIDVTSQLMVNDRLDVFGNLSWVNDNFFDDEELDEPGTGLELSMNAPKIKLKGGFDYAIPNGLRVNASVRHIGGFEVSSGPYQGPVDAYTLFDMGAGYDLSTIAPGLRIDVTVMNVFNEEHREFIGAPKLGRLALARLTYDV